MITFKQELIVTNDDPKADYYKKNLTKESGWMIEEDTTARKYAQTIYYKHYIDEDGTEVCYPAEVLHMGEEE